MTASSRVRVYRLMNLENNRMGQPFCVCDDCLKYYDPAITNNVDTRLMEDLMETLVEGCRCYRHDLSGKAA